MRGWRSGAHWEETSWNIAHLKQLRLRIHSLTAPWRKRWWRLTIHSPFYLLYSFVLKANEERVLAVNLGNNRTKKPLSSSCFSRSSDFVLPAPGKGGWRVRNKESQASGCWLPGILIRFLARTGMWKALEFTDPPCKTDETVITIGVPKGSSRRKNVA